MDKKGAVLLAVFTTRREPWREDRSETVEARAGSFSPAWGTRQEHVSGLGQL